jgi:isoquinoline 1-oxidoreductase alpha subunit
MPSLTLNDQPVDIAIDPATPLLWALRDVANLTGTKYGCGTGECGACMVLVDGQAIPSCTLSLAEAAGRAVITIEGIGHNPAGDQAAGRPGGLHPVQQALVDEQAIQCGFCTPGLVIAIVALLQANPHPSDEQIRAGIGNICRCGVYPRLIRAVRRVTGPVSPPPPPVGAATGPLTGDGGGGGDGAASAQGATGAPSAED